MAQQNCKFDVEVDWIELLIGIFINFSLISTWWYGVFSQTWLNAMNFKMEDFKNCNMKNSLIIEFISKVLFTFGVYHIIGYLNLKELDQYILLAIWISAVYIVLGLMHPILWEKRPASYVIVNASERILSLVLTVLFFYTWRNALSIEQKIENVQEQVQQNIEQQVGIEA
ncbi:hypothetical protein PPERSA_03982 [Pseudocohnilembus persalinus]|uniref:Uncharacterized protein n=1 Tax=Pseudocohnilembus persalinus TaxID=266149 RepID=A0A0V0QBD2_PSEPJ|nr:hypothetical protein PPERSA_03982 [Pseudocohnilembus persalinus]|eukprot:KRW99512.1 hypothetical protein PPERSA_03982 [Pseudocohnilembus persalinus]